MREARGRFEEQAAKVKAMNYLISNDMIRQEKLKEFVQKLVIDDWQKVEYTQTIQGRKVG